VTLDKQKIGDWGEKVSETLLQQHGYNEVVNLNKVKHNFPVFDLLAQKDGNYYLFTIKARNKYNPSNGKLNRQYNILVTKKSRYKLKRALDLVEEIFKIKNPKLYWITSPIDYSTSLQSFYYGELTHLENWKKLEKEDTYIGVKMNDEVLKSYSILGESTFY